MEEVEELPALLEVYEILQPLLLDALITIVFDYVPLHCIWSVEGGADSNYLECDGENYEPEKQHWSFQEREFSPRDARCNGYAFKSWDVVQILLKASVELLETPTQFADLIEHFWFSDNRKKSSSNQPYDVEVTVHWKGDSESEFEPNLFHRSCLLTAFASLFRVEIFKIKMKHVKCCYQIEELTEAWTDQTYFIKWIQSRHPGILSV